ncbi:MAG: DUF499 domain-containing protein [Nitrososphaerota archaeon]
MVSQLPPAWRLCEFSEEIENGVFDESRFGIEFFQVLEGSASPIYQDPRSFLENTYLTSEMKEIVKGVLRRLSRNEGTPVYVIDTEFGGGKTHTLILLYHLFRNRDLAREYLEKNELLREIGVLEVPEVRVVAIDCQRVRRNTLWGEVADAFGRYADFEELDRNRLPVTNIDTIRSLLDRPTLLLIDELPKYLLGASATSVGGTTLAELTIHFVLQLMSAVATSRNCVMVVTLTAEQALYRRWVSEFKKKLDEHIVTDLTEKLTEGLRKHANFYVPVRGEEIYKVVRKRLVRKITDWNAVEKVIAAYADYLEQHRLADGYEYRKKLKSAYPFHPYLIDILYERTSTIEQFHKTRGVLRFLARLAHVVKRNGVDAPLISPGEVDLGDTLILNALTSELKKEQLRPVAMADVIEKGKKLDMKREVKLAERCARSIFLFSLTGAVTPSGMRPLEVKLAVCRPGIDPSIVDEVLEMMRNEFWYLEVDASGGFYFTTEPNINRMVYEKMQEIESSKQRMMEVEEEVRNRLEKVFGTVENVELVIWDEEKVPDDSEKLKVFVMDYKGLPERYDEKDDEKALLERARRVIEFVMPGSRIRKYRNNVLVVAPDVTSAKSMVRDVIELKAIEEVKKDERIRVDRSKVEELKKRASKAEANFVTDCISTYSKLVYPRLGDGELYVDELVLQERELRGGYLQKILDHLAKQGKLLKAEDKLNEGVLLELLSKSEQGYLQVEEVYSTLKTDKRMPYILSGNPVVEAVKKGVKDGLFGYSQELVREGEKYRAQIGVELAVKEVWRGFIIRKDLVAGLIERPPPPTIPEILEGTKEEKLQTIHSYVIPCADARSMTNVLSSLHVLLTGKSGIKRRFEATLRNENVEVTVKSELRNITEVRDLISYLSSRRLDGAGKAFLWSAEDLSGELEKLGVK